jgi:hypothetical protein
VEQVLGKVLCLNNSSLFDIVKLYDPKGAQRINMQGASDQRALNAVRVPILQVIVPGVYMSPLISDSNKAEFLLALFDTTDMGSLSEMQFVEYRWTFKLAMSRLFSLDPPDRESTLKGCAIFFDRMSKNAAKILLSKYHNTSFTKQDVLDAINARNHRLVKQVSLMDEEESVDQQRIPLHVLKDNLYYGEAQDPMMFFAVLALHRFSSARLNPDFVDEFGDEFKFSYSSPPPIPRSGAMHVTWRGAACAIARATPATSLPSLKARSTTISWPRRGSRRNAAATDAAVCAPST